jgi:DNA topoisomerase-1
MFARVLPALRKKVKAHMSLPGLPRKKVIATVVYLLDKTLIRVGNEDYAKQNKSYGLTTLKNRHAEVDGTEVRFHFIGKSGKQWTTKIRDRRVAKIIVNAKNFRDRIFCNTEPRQVKYKAFPRTT